MTQKAHKMSYVSSFENSSILRKFAILFLLASIVPMALLYYIYVQNNLHGHIGINPVNFTIVMVLMVGGVLVGYMSMHALLKKVVDISNANSNALSKILSPQTVREVNEGENEIDILNRSFSAVTQQLEEQLRKLKSMYELQKEFIATMSHELRTPLASIKMALSLVSQETMGTINNDQKEILGRAQQETDRLKRLVDDILYLSKMEADKLQMNLMMNDVHRVMIPVIESQRQVAKSRGLYLKADIDPVITKAYFDSDRIIQVLNNILNNAIKFTKEGGVTVKIQNKISENSILISVIDTGKGIAEEDFPKLFQKFQQIGSSHKGEDSGSGLGLSICKEIILRHEGKIWVESKLGEGTTFHFTLPIHEKKPTPVFHLTLHDA